MGRPLEIELDIGAAASATSTIDAERRRGPAAIGFRLGDGR